MNFKRLHHLRPALLALSLLLLGITLLAQGAGTSLAAPNAQFILRWDDLSPDLPAVPDFVINDANPSEINTNFSGAADPHKDPYHGLGSSTGGLSGFDSQVFTNSSGSGLTLTVYYSRNNHDGNALEGPDLYGPFVQNVRDPNPDRRVTAVWDLRMTRDHIVQRTPTTVVFSFSAPILMDEFIVASLSTVSASHEHAITRAFLTADATGPVVKATQFINISDLNDGSTLLNGLWDPTGPLTVNALTNVAVDPDLVDSNNDGVYENVGSAADDGVYHVYGVGSQSASRYGRVKLVYGQPVRSIAVSFFPTSTANANPFTDTAYTDQWISTIVAPFVFSPYSPTAVSLQHVAVNDGLSPAGVVWILLFLLVALSAAGLAWSRRRLTAS